LTSDGGAGGRESGVTPSVTKGDLVRDLRALGIGPGDLLNAKVSLKSIGHVVGGAETLLEAILEAISPGGTVITDSFVPVYPLPLSPENAAKVSDSQTRSYAGALANAVVRHPKAVRSTHPVQKFAAIGARAKEFLEPHRPGSYAYDVLRVMAESGGRNLKIGSEEKNVGVGTTHVAIGLLKLRQKRLPAGVNYVDATGRIATFERDWAGACARGLLNFVPFYRTAGAVVSEGRVGLAETKITDMKQTLAVELDMLRKDPSFLTCKDQTCVDCRLGWEFSRGTFLGVALENLRQGRLSAARYALRVRQSRNYLPPL